MITVEAVVATFVVRTKTDMMFADDPKSAVPTSVYAPAPPLLLSEHVGAAFVLPLTVERDDDRSVLRNRPRRNSASVGRDGVSPGGRLLRGRAELSLLKLG